MGARPRTATASGREPTGARPSEHPERVSASLDMYFQIKKQRETIVAPVDTMGCGAVPTCLTDEERMFHILTSLLLSSQTKDEVTHEAMTNLRRLLTSNAPDGRNGLTVENVVQASVEHINKCISRVGFHNRKAANLKSIADILAKKGLPTKMEDLLGLPGIGNKMAILYMSHAQGKVVGISVDTHVHRVSNRIGLANTKDPDKTRRALEGVVPRSEWKAVNNVLVGFGQTICTAKAPLCKQCCVRDRCPSSLF